MYTKQSESAHPQGETQQHIRRVRSHSKRQLQLKLQPHSTQACGCWQIGCRKNAAGPQQQNNRKKPQLRLLS